MTAQLLFQPVWTALDANGNIIPGAKAYFYVTSTLSAASVYTTSALSTPRTQPVVADSAARFPVIYLDNSVAYRVQLRDANDNLIANIDPLNVAALGASIATADLQDGSVTGVKLSNTAIADKLGYTPASTAGGSLTGPFRLNYATPPTVQNADDVGFRGLPPVTKDASWTFVLSDAGRLYVHTDSTARVWSIAPNSTTAFPVGTVIAGYNAGTGAVTLTRGAGVTIRKAGSGTSQDVVVAQFGDFAFKQVQTDVWIVSGAGIS